jgi:hypothetical protein
VLSTPIRDFVIQKKSLLWFIFVKRESSYPSRIEISTQLRQDSLYVNKNLFVIEHRLVTIGHLSEFLNLQSDETIFLDHLLLDLFEKHVDCFPLNGLQIL